MYRSIKSNGREPKSCLGRVFNFKLGRFAMLAVAWRMQAHPCLELKTRPRFHPLSFKFGINIRPGRKTSSGTNALAYLSRRLSRKKSFMTLAPEALQDAQSPSQIGLIHPNQKEKFISKHLYLVD